MTGKEEKGKSFTWRNGTEHLVFFIVYIMEWSLFNFFLFETPTLNPSEEPTLLHVLVMTIILGSPTLFFQIFVGNYTERGCIFMGEMLPVAYGLGYSMLLLSFVRFIYSLFYTIKILSYFLNGILSRRPPWMICGKFHGAVPNLLPDCFGKEDFDRCPTRTVTDEPCFAPGTKTLSTLIYKQVKVFFRTEKRPRILRNLKIINHVFHLVFLAPLLLIFSLKGIKTFSLSLRISIIFCLGAFLSILVVLLTKPGPGVGLNEMLHKINVDSLINLHTWVVTFRRVIQGLKLAEGGHILFGSFIPKSSKQSHGFLQLPIIFCVLTFSTFFYYYIYVGLLMFNIGLTVQQLGVKTEEDLVFVIFPTVLGIQASSYFFSSVSFLVYFILNFNSLVLKVFVIEKTITAHFDIHEYSHYMSVLIIALGALLTIPLEFLSYRIIEIIENEFKYLQTCALALQMLVLATYGVQRISDDVSFYTRSEVKKFTKLCWLVSFVLSIGCYYYEFTKKPPQNKIVRIVVCATFALPFVLYFFIKTFAYIRIKKVIGLLRPSDLYGPRDVEERVLRILYNPRLAIRSKGREEGCYHKCLNSSNVVQVAVEEEISLIQKFITDLRSDPADEELNNQIIKELVAYQEILRHKLSEKRRSAP